MVKSCGSCLGRVARAVGLRTLDGVGVKGRPMSERDRSVISEREAVGEKMVERDGDGVADGDEEARLVGRSGNLISEQEDTERGVLGRLRGEAIVGVGRTSREFPSTDYIADRLKTRR